MGRKRLVTPVSLWLGLGGARLGALATPVGGGAVAVDVGHRRSLGRRSREQLGDLEPNADLDAAGIPSLRSLLRDDYPLRRIAAGSNAVRQIARSVLVVLVGVVATVGGARVAI